MLQLVLKTFRSHAAGYRTTAIITLFGTALLTAFTTLLSTGLDRRFAPDDRSFLLQFPAILGGWSIAIVLFAVVSTTRVVADGRAEEFAALSRIGATPRQLRRMIAVETVIVSAVTAVPGVLLGAGAGGLIMGQLHRIGRVEAATTLAPDLLVVVAGAALLVIAAGVAVARSSNSRPPRTGTAHGRGRIIGAVVLVLLGVGSSSAVFGMAPDSVVATAATGPGCVLTAIGLSMLAPWTTRLTARLMGPLLGRSAPAHLARITLRVAVDRISPIVTFLTLYVGVAAGTLTMQAIENDRAGVTDSQGQLMASINYLVVVLIAGFMAVALANALIAAVGRRRGEFRTVHLIGGTERQGRRTLAAESAVAVVAASVTGVLGALVTVLPFAVVKAGAVSGVLQPWPVALTVVVGVALVAAATRAAATRTIGAAYRAAAVG